MNAATLAAARGALILSAWLLMPLAFGMAAQLTSPGFVTSSRPWSLTRSCA
jgi:hypothetical protein